MAAVGMILFWIGFLISIVGGIWLLVVMFKESILWGIGGILCGIVPLIFVILHWDKGGNPFLISLGGTVLLFIGIFLAPEAMGYIE